jgi:hypothetical protein
MEKGHGGRRAWILAMAIGSALLLPGCGSEDTGTSPTPDVTLVTDTFSGSIGRNASSIHEFTVTSASYPLLAGITSLSPTSISALGLGIGTWDSSTSTCGLNVTQNDAALSGSTGLTGSPASGSYCLRVYDGGNIPAGETASYSVQIQHY